MALAHVTKTGNISIPKTWRDELGIEPNSDVIIDMVKDKIIIEPLKKDSLKEIFSGIDQEIKKRNIKFTRAEAIRDDLYD
ncbi:AbrB/MazE/SpoVT family DNA-binding domain-containing protein [Candidatus Woesearchaeota archaeon]|nr:AbrB/MazE/SpoVT family DNA-binding domain-containing protein [Candidatus Woesearchaeota archaeon]